MNNKVVVITGASAGIGAALAIKLAAQGANTVLLARRTEELAAVVAKCGGDAHCLAVTTDVTKRADVERARDQALAKFGHVDVWVNNAGRGMSRLVSQLTDEDIDEMMLVNVKSVVYCVQAILPHFQAKNSGHIINVSSVLGRLPWLAPRSCYSAAKHALNGITAGLRLELAGTGIRVSTVSPGPVATEFGVNSVHGGFDSRKLPNAQPAEEVAEVIVNVIQNPRADVYTRPIYKQQVAQYFSADDCETIEMQWTNSAAAVKKP